MLAPTLFETAKASKFADKTALFVTKKKLLRMLEAGTDIAVAAEAPPPEYIQMAGEVEPIYSIEINWWLPPCGARDFAERRPRTRLLLNNGLGPTQIRPRCRTVATPSRNTLTKSSVKL